MCNGYRLTGGLDCVLAGLVVLLRQSQGLCQPTGGGRVGSLSMAGSWASSVPGVVFAHSFLRSGSGVTGYKVCVARIGASILVCRTGS